MPEYLIPNLLNAGRVLKLLASEPDLTVLQISRKLQVPRTSVLRIVSSLEREGMLEISRDNQCSLGPALIYLGMRAMSGIDLAGLARPLLKQLSTETGETAHLAMLSDDKSLLLEVCQSPLPIRAGAPAGTMTDLYCSATGKVFLAWSLSDKLEELFERVKPVSRTSRTITDAASMEKETRMIRKLGYAVDEEEFYDGIRCVAVPVFNGRGHANIALGITGVTGRLTRKRLPACAAQLQEAAATLSAAIGHNRKH
ncbi:MAG: IclR family transcriptional regulator [Kiritimatiellae bacterium]|nr:IclR family transcriptional regulator [Kiritimatiellia bacterium]